LPHIPPPFLSFGREEGEGKGGREGGGEEEGREDGGEGGRPCILTLGLNPCVQKVKEEEGGEGGRE
jgi:hypothetical protein